MNMAFQVGGDELKGFSGAGVGESAGELCGG